MHLDSAESATTRRCKTPEYTSVLFMPCRSLQNVTCSSCARSGQRLESLDCDMAVVDNTLELKDDVRTEYI